MQDIQSVAQYAKNALDMLAQLLEVGKDVTSLIAITSERLEAMSSQKRGPTTEEWDAQNEEIRRLQSDLHSDTDSGQQIG